MADWGLYSALAGQNNWDAVRQGRSQELQLAVMQNAIEDQKLNKEQQSAAALQDYFAKVRGGIKVLDPAIERARGIESELAKPIREGLMKAKGDVRRFMMTGGLNELARYQEKIMAHPTIRKDLMSAYNYNRMKADEDAGLNPRGNARAALKSYMDNESDYFDYGGAYKRPAYDAATHFAAQYGKDEYKKEAVHPEALARYVFEAAKKEGLSDADAQDFAINETKKYVGYVQGGANPFFYKSKDPMERELMRAKIAKLGQGANVPGQDWLLHFKQNKITPDEVTPFYKDQGVGFMKYNIGYDLAKGLSNVVGLELDNKGDVVNKESVIKNGQLYIGKEKLDIAGLVPENIKSMQPTGRAVKTLDDKGNWVDGLEYAVTINEPGIEKTKYKGQNIDRVVNDAEVPFSTRNETKWNPLSSDDYSLTFTTVVPISNKPQVFEEYRRIMQRNSPSAIGGTNFSFGATQQLQDAILMEGDQILNEPENAQQ